MSVRVITSTPPSELARALERFEERFTYPLGPGRSFRISHGDDYPRFFRAMGATGDAACFVAENRAGVIGVLGAALRRLTRPDGGEAPVVYLGDLKIDPSARGGFALLSLARAVSEWARGRAAAAFAVVMDGTAVTPAAYTGRAGLPPFAAIAHVDVLRIPTDGVVPASHPAADAAAATTAFARLAAGRFVAHGGRPEERSEIAPAWSLAADGGAVGRIEDTRRAKRLIADDAGELRSAHLSRFAYRDAAAGVRFLASCVAHATALGFPALFVAIDRADAADFLRGLARPDIVVAPATVFATGLPAGGRWIVDTAEI